MSKALLLKLEFFKEFSKYYKPSFEINQVVCKNNSCATCQFNDGHCKPVVFNDSDIEEMANEYPEYML